MVVGRGKMGELSGRCIVNCDCETEGAAAMDVKQMREGMEEEEEGEILGLRKAK